MADETRKLLKIFGVAVTDFEAEAEKLEAAAAQLPAANGKDQIAKLLKDATELSRELNTRWLETTQHIFSIQNRLLLSLAVPTQARGCILWTRAARSNRPGWKPMNKDRKRARLTNPIPDQKEDVSCRRP